MLPIIDDNIEEKMTKDTEMVIPYLFETSAFFRMTSKLFWFMVDAEGWSISGVL